MHSDVKVMGFCQAVAAYRVKGVCVVQIEPATNRVLVGFFKDEILTVDENLVPAREVSFQLGDVNFGRLRVFILCSHLFGEWRGSKRGCHSLE
jgi:hypothetical protein